MRRAILVVLIAGLVAAGCGDETPIQKCDRLRSAARKAIQAYLDVESAARKQAFGDGSDSSRWQTVVNAQTTLTAARREVVCGYLESMPSRPQPARRDLDELTFRAGAATRAAREIVTKLVDAGTVVATATATEVTRAADALDARMKSWDDTVMDDRLQPGAPWSSGQRLYLSSVEIVWCALDTRVSPLIAAKITALDHEADALETRIHAGLDAATLHLDHGVAGYELTKQLDLDTGRPVPVPTQLLDDPGFATARLAIKTFDECRLD